MRHHGGKLAGVAATVWLLSTAASLPVWAQVARPPSPADPPRLPPENEYIYKQEPPAIPPGAVRVPLRRDGFGPDPNYADKPYDPQAQLDIYGGKKAVPVLRPPLEFGYPLYSAGPMLGEGFNLLGDKNRLFPQLLVYGDFRTAVAYNDNGAAEVGQVATRLNLDVDLKLTGTERIHAFFRPLDRGGKFTRCEFSGGDSEDDCDLQLDGNVETLFLEGDLGSLYSGFTDEYAKFDRPFAVGLTPFLFQNGIWAEDAFIGGAYTIPSRNSPKLDISNMDFTFFAGFDKVTTAAIRDRNNQFADHDANIYGVATFIETLSGYIEAGYGYTQDTRDLGFDYHNLTAAFTRRYGGWLSNSVRGIVNFGQDPDGNRRQTADGFLLLIENSLITRLPSTLIPYFNFFAGFDRPQSLARDAGAGGVLKNTGINFETDGLTDFPKLDDTANDTYGGAIGLEYLFNLNQQIVVEVATVQVRDDDKVTVAGDDQYAVGLRYQIPLDDRWIFRADAIYAFLQDRDDFSGVRVEIRRKF